MIKTWTGKTGSGKTYSMVEASFYHWKKGRTICSNTILFFYPPKYNVKRKHDIEKYPELFSRYEHFKWKLRKLVKYKVNKIPARGRIKYFELLEEIQDEHYALILFDEAQVLFNARHWQSLSAEFQYKLEQHRKHSLDLYCTTQNLAMIDVTYRRLIHTWVYCEYRMKFLGFFLFFRYLKNPNVIYGAVEDLTAPTIAVQRCLLTPWTTRLYDTLYDVGFRRFNMIWNSKIVLDKEGKPKRVPSLLIFPKTMSMSDASRLQRSLEGKSSPNSSENLSED